MIRMFEHAEKVVKKLTKENMEHLRRQIDECLKMAIKFDETGKAKYFVKMKNSCQTFLQMLNELEKKADS
ncbi:MAG: hypothetical protein QXL57_04975 [Candidatus Bathyarchaeia archaeon]